MKNWVKKVAKKPVQKQSIQTLPGMDKRAAELMPRGGKVMR